MLVRGFLVWSSFKFKFNLYINLFTCCLCPTELQVWKNDSSGLYNHTIRFTLEFTFTNVIDYKYETRILIRHDRLGKKLGSLRKEVFSTSRHSICGPFGENIFFSLVQSPFPSSFSHLSSLLTLFAVASNYMNMIY